MKEKSEIAKEALERWIESARNAHQIDRQQTDSIIKVMKQRDRFLFHKGRANGNSGTVTFRL